MKFIQFNINLYILKYIFERKKYFYVILLKWGLGIGDWGLGIGDW
jgi:hypothetical protein